MKDFFIEELQRSLREMHGSSIELFSRELVHDYAFLEFRVASTRFGGAKWQCAVEFLVHHLLDPTSRQVVFSSPYDLGSSVQLKPAQVKQKQIEMALANYALVGSDGEVPTPISLEDIIKKLKRFVLEMTEIPYRDYTGPCEGSSDTDLNASVATKVIFTLYRFRRQWPKFFLRYAKPDFDGRASLELRDAHPLEGFDNVAKQGVALHADLKVALSYGMTSEEIATVLPAMEQISIRFEVSSATSSEWLLIHATEGQRRPPALPLLRDIQEALPAGPRSLPERLDKSLYTALVLREAENRVAAKRHINIFLESAESGLPKLCPTQNDFYNLVMSRRENDKSTYISTLAKVVGCSIDLEQFEAAHNLQQSLRFIIKNPFTDATLNHFEYLASIITCLDLGPSPIYLKAHWHGKATTSNRPDYHLKQINSHKALRTIPEFYQEYWFRRYSLTCCLLMNAKESWDEHNRVEQAEFEYIVNVFRTHELSKACSLIDSYFNKFPKIPY